MDRSGPVGALVGSGVMEVGRVVRGAGRIAKAEVER